MSLAIPSLSPALSAAAVQSHPHGHKKGAQLDLSSLLEPSDSATTAAPQAPAGSAQNALGRLFGFVVRTIGIPLPPKATAAIAVNAATAAVSSPTAGSKINVTA